MILVIFLLTIVLITALVKLKTPFWSPPAIMSIIWLFFIYSSLLLFSFYNWQFFSLAWIIISCISVLAGYTLLNKIVYERDTKNIIKIQKMIVNKRLIKISLISSIVLGLSYGVIKLQTLGFSVKDVLDFSQLGYINNAVAVLRYSDSTDNAIYMQALLSFVYLSCLLGGLLFSISKNNREKLLALLSFIPEIFIFSFTNEKATLIICVLFWGLTFLMGYMRLRGGFPEMHRLGFLKLVGFAALFITVLAISMSLRLGEVSEDNLSTVSQKIQNSYAFSQVPAFDSIFLDIGSQPRTYGLVTFYGISNTIGLSTRGQGVYQDSFSYDDLGTNVYTAFRGLVTDFGYFGGLLFMFVVGALSAMGVARLKWQSTMPVFSIVMLTAIYSFIIFGLFVSIFSYMSLIVSLALFGIILFFASKYKTSRLIQYKEVTD